MALLLFVTFVGFPVKIFAQQESVTDSVVEAHKIRVRTPFGSLERPQIVEHQQGGRKHEPEIGRLLVSDRSAKLPLKDEGGSDRPTSRLHRLVRACGSWDRNRRPKIDEVLAEAKGIYDSLSGSGGYSWERARLRFVELHRSRGEEKGSKAVGCCHLVLVGFPR